MTTTPTPPSATEGDRALAIAVACRLSTHAITNDDQYRHEAAELIAAHTSAAVAEAVSQAVGALEREIAVLKENFEVASTHWENSKSNYELKLSQVIPAFEELTGDKEKAESERDSLRALVVRMRELLSVFDKVPALIVESTSPENALESVVKCITLFKGKALALVPADLADSVCVKRSEWERLQRLSEREFKSP